MKCSCKCVAMLVCLMLLNSALSQQKKYQIAVLDFEARSGVSAGEAASLSDIFCGNLVQTGKYIVVERNRIKAILMEQGFQQTEACSSVECVVEAGKILKVQKIFTGTVGKIGRLYTLSVQMIDVATAQIESNKSRQHSGDIEDLATTIIPEIATEITEELTGEEVEIEQHVTKKAYKKFEIFIGTGAGDAEHIKFTQPNRFDEAIGMKGLVTIACYYNISRYFALGIRILGFHHNWDGLRITMPYPPYIAYSASMEYNSNTVSLEGRIILIRGEIFEPYITLVFGRINGNLNLYSDEFGDRGTSYSGGGGGVGLGVKTLISSNIGVSLELRAIGGGGAWKNRDFAEGLYLDQDNADASYRGLLLSCFYQF